MKGRPVFVGCVAVLVLTACGGAGVSAGSHPHTAVASSSVSVVGMSAPPSASVSVMGSEQAAAVESAAGKAIRDKVKEDGGPIPKEVANVSFHPNLDDNVDVTAHVVSIKAGPTGTVLTFWLTSNTIDHAMGPVFPEDFPSLVDTVGGVKYGVNYFSKAGDTSKFVVGSEEPEIDAKSVYVMQASYPPLPKSVAKVKIAIGSAKTSPDIPVTR